MDYISPREAAEKWGISLRRVQVLCFRGQISGAERFGARTWMIPKSAPKPLDGRTKAAQAIKNTSGGKKDGEERS